MGWVSGQPVFVMMSLAAALVVAHAAAANENGTNAVGALHIACKNGHTDAVRLLLDGGAEVDLPAQDGVTPLVIACMNGHVEVTRLLLEKGAAVDRAVEEGATPLIVACQNGHVEVARLLLDNGAEVDRAAENGATPLFMACQNGHVDVARLLLERGADDEIETAWSWWDPQRWWFRLHTPLGAAQDGARRGELGYDEIVELIQAKQRQRHQEGTTADQEL